MEGAGSRHTQAFEQTEGVLKERSQSGYRYNQYRGPAIEQKKSGSSKITIKSRAVTEAGLSRTQSTTRTRTSPSNPGERSSSDLDGSKMLGMLLPTL
ncbi:hypothetical protein GGTG_08071 [Gaeumannomyces tritici R3-111a-1]|uniref:Uncharacterized protein n=1 Tax=Gaeumannomyces tritici (strain R3-111a-1) TaxID=644352 RepID=J3P3I5_GAET3|nr:hypothetical protein GGTG_08071 [Gaeumannomyces tritici R3-111a-1]EJT74227.1 hypothetical protein GGTG_08071 [Gaeumannomyces tritici R3-111a-1]